MAGAAVPAEKRLGLGEREVSDSLRDRRAFSFSRKEVHLRAGYSCGAVVTELTAGG